jgi:hypothetical protein
MLLGLIVCDGLVVGWDDPRGLKTNSINTLPQHYSHKVSLTYPGHLGRQLHLKQSMWDSPAPTTAISGLGGGGAG